MPPFKPEKTRHDDPFREGTTSPRESDELRIKKNDGFFGVTLPVMFILKGAEAQTAAQYTTPFFTANRDYYLISVTERHETAGGAPGDAAMMLYKVPSGTAPASGTAMLSGNLALTTTANTNQSGSLVTTAGGLLIPRGYSLSWVSTGTITAVVGVTASILLKAV